MLLLNAIRCYDATFSLLPKTLLKIALFPSADSYRIYTLVAIAIIIYIGYYLQMQKYLNEHCLHVSELYLISFVSFSRPEAQAHHTVAVSESKEIYFIIIRIKETPRKLYTWTRIILIRCEIRSLRRNVEFADFQSYFHFLVALHQRFGTNLPIRQIDRTAKAFIKMIFISFIVIFNSRQNERDNGKGVWWLTLHLMMRRRRQRRINDEGEVQQMSVFNIHITLLYALGKIYI